MKLHSFVLLSLFLACNSTQKPLARNQDPQAVNTAIDPLPFSRTITAEELKEHLYTYASDEFEGRETGQPGQKKAANYLKKAYQKLGIPAARGGDDYFQDVPLEIGQIPSGSIFVNGTEYPLGDDVLSFSAAEGDYSEVVYLGYGIDTKVYSDYNRVDVQDKLVLVKAGEPRNADGSFVVSGTSEKSVWSNPSEAFGKRLKAASKHGAKGMLYYDQNNFNRFKSQYRYMKNNGNSRMALKPKKKALAAFFIYSEVAQELFPQIGESEMAKAIAVTLQLQVKSTNTEVKSENVVALLKGSEKPDEYVVLSSHLDHIGMEADGDINNGADDDGSGTVAMLEIAEAFKKAADAGKGPKRSLVFLHVTGEEKGLLGSQYYTDMEPLIPLDQTVANLNIDMIGRVDPKREGSQNYIYLIGSDRLSTELHELSEEANKKYIQLELDYTYNDRNDPNRFYFRSDHYNFAKNNIPIIFYFNGTHDDYHRPSDTPDKINYDLLKSRTQLIFHTAWDLANRDQRVVVDKDGK